MIYISFMWGTKIRDLLCPWKKFPPVGGYESSRWRIWILHLFQIRSFAYNFIPYEFSSPCGLELLLPFQSLFFGHEIFGVNQYPRSKFYGVSLGGPFIMEDQPILYIWTIANVYFSILFTEKDICGEHGRQYT